MYEHNKDQLLYGAMFYLLLTVAANTFLWFLASNTTLQCM
jgi:hypothetical protein